MSTPITFNANWSPNGTPTNVATATIGILDTTTNSQVVAGGTAMGNPSTGNYAYVYASAIAGHSYLGTMSLTATNGAQGTFQQVIFVPTTGPGSNSPVTSSGQMAGLWQQQLADVTAAKTAAISAITTVLSLGNPGGVTYIISGTCASESVDLAGFMSIMQQQVKTFAELELMLVEAL